MNTKLIAPVVAIVLTFFVVGTMSACVGPYSPYGSTDANDGALKQFRSSAELEAFLNQNTNTDYYGGYATLSGARSLAMDTVAVEATVDASESAKAVPAAQNSAGEDSGSSDYSETNVQVAGVDEADIIKTDGEYIYYVANNKVYIISAVPAKDAEILSEIEFDNGYISQIYINDDKLIVLGQENYDIKRDDTLGEKVAGTLDLAATSRIMPYPMRQTRSVVRIYDISDKEDPEQEEDISLEGYHLDSRMVGNYVYVIINKYVYNDFIPPIIYYSGGTREIKASDISYIDMPDSSYDLSMILAIDLTDDSFDEKTILKGSSQNVYVSEDNIYLVSQKYVPYYMEQQRILEEVLMKYLPSDVKAKIELIKNYDLRESTKLSEIQYLVEEYFNSLDYDEQQQITEDAQKDVDTIELEIAKERDTTVITRVAIDGLAISYEAAGEVPGRVLNQFSMDESDGYFRIATTAGNSWNDNYPQSNAVYVLDMDLDVVGKLTDLAPDEQIYSARFMGEKAYLVTYKNVDPLFVIDLSDPENPSVLGKLKIPGYSSYLHPYGEDYLIGIGKDTEELKENEGRSTVKGLKMALFDVSDVEHPKQVADLVIGDRGSDSPVLWDHKAFVFDASRNLLMMPVRVAEIDPEKYTDEQLQWAYGDTVFQGVYVYHVTPEDGFEKLGEVSHVDPESYEKSGYYYYSRSEIDRSLYIGDVLYTFSDTDVMAHSLDDFKELADLEIAENDTVYPEPYLMEDDVAATKGSESAAEAVDTVEAD